MVGGSSKLPLMVELLTELFGRKPSVPAGPFGEIDPLLAVSRGAAVDDLNRDEEHGLGGANVPSTVPVLERRLPYAISLVVDRKEAVECLVGEGSALPFGPVSKTLYMPTDDDNIDINLVRGCGAPDSCTPMTRRTVYFERVIRKGEELYFRWYVSDDGQITVSIVGADGVAIEAVTAPRLEEALV
jgi:hypothetical protein